MRFVEKQIDKIMKLINFRYFLLLILLLTGVLQVGVMLGNVQEATYNFKPLQLAPETVRSTKTIEDAVKTEQEKAKAAQEVKPVYVFSEAIAGQRTAIVNSLFEYITTAKSESEDIEEQVKSLKKKLASVDKKEITIDLTDEQLRALLVLDDKQLLHAKKEVLSFVKGTLERPIRTERLASEQDGMESKIRARLPLSLNAQDAIVHIGRASIIETELLDKDQTDRLIEQARASVEPTRLLFQSKTIYS